MRTPRYAEAAKLRAAGLSYRAIADRLQVSLPTAFRWCQKPQGASSGSSGAVVKAPVVTGEPLAENSLDLATPRAVLSEIDVVYRNLDAQGYTATAALKLKTLNSKLDAMRRIEPSPCANHITVTAVDRRIRELVDTVMQEFRRALGTAQPEGREYADAAVEALFERCKTRFNGTLRTFNEEDSWHAGDLVDE